jgi:hypothetical protein
MGNNWRQPRPLRHRLQPTRPPLSPKLRTLGMDAPTCRQWIAPLVEANRWMAQAVFIAPSAFHASHVRTQFGVQLERALGCQVELRHAPAAAGDGRHARRRETAAQAGDDGSTKRVDAQKTEREFPSRVGFPLDRPPFGWQFPPKSPRIGWKFPRDRPP